MFKKSMFYCVMLATMLLANNCSPEPTPDAITVSAFLELYKEADACPAPTPEPSGEISYESWMQGGFSGTLKLTGLNPNQSYTFTINGKQGSPGNDLLQSSCPDSADYNEGFCDFSIRSDSQGAINVSIPLNKGQYAAKFFIKDNEQDYCPLLYNNNPPNFEIK